MFGDVPGVHIVADDMIVAAETEDQHDEILRKVMERAKVNNVKFNKEKDKVQSKRSCIRWECGQ